MRNHAPDIAAMDLFVVPTIGLDLLYAFVIVRLGRRDLVWINVTTNSTAERITRQISEAFPWDVAPLCVPKTLWSALLRRALPITFLMCCFTA